MLARGGGMRAACAASARAAYAPGSVARRHLGLSRSLLVAQEQLAQGVDTAFMQAKIITARFYADHLLTKAPGMRDSIVEGADSVNALALEAF